MMIEMASIETDKAVVELERLRKKLEELEKTALKTDEKRSRRASFA